MKTEQQTDYTEAVVRKTPSHLDPQDIAFVAKLRESVLSQPWTKEAFAEIKQAQIAYLREVLARSEDTEFVFARTQEILKEVSLLQHSAIAEGGENLNGLERGAPVILATNHLSTYKLAGFSPETELGLKIRDYRYLCPTPMFIGGFTPVAEKLGNTLAIVSDDFPGVLGQIHRAAGFVHVPPKETTGGSRIEYLREQTAEVFKKHPQTALVNFPEGQSSGKHRGLGPYELERFRTGGYVIAAELGVRVIPVAQYFDPKQGLQLKVFPSYIPKQNEDAGYKVYAKRDQEEMQKWLDAKLGR